MSERGDALAFCDPGVAEVYGAIIRLNMAGRSTNNSQIASMSGVPRTRVAEVTAMLKSRGFIKNVSNGSAYHWRITKKPVPVTT